jgi:DNA-binding Lrp family transcriptional regulator
VSAVGAHPVTPLERRLLDGYQDGLPLVPRPFAQIAAELGVTEDQVLASLDRLQQGGVVSRVGPVLRPHRVGVSTLAAMAVPPARLEAIAERVSALPEVNHNYAREHHFNLWFVVTASDREHLRTVLDTLTEGTGLEVMELPMVAEYFIDLGFKLQWT